MYKNTRTVMIFDWDETKNRAKRAKHRVSFEAAALVFEDPHAVGVPDRVEEGEERWQTVGMAGRRGGEVLPPHQEAGDDSRGCRCAGVAETPGAWLPDEDQQTVA